MIFLLNIYSTYTDNKPLLFQSSLLKTTTCLFIPLFSPPRAGWHDFSESCQIVRFWQSRGGAGGSIQCSCCVYSVVTAYSAVQSDTSNLQQATRGENGKCNCNGNFNCLLYLVCNVFLLHELYFAFCARTSLDLVRSKMNCDTKHWHWSSADCVVGAGWEFLDESFFPFLTIVVWLEYPKYPKDWTLLCQISASSWDVENSVLFSWK